MNVIDMIPTGEANRISAQMLKALTGLDAAEIRRQINKARANGVPLCSSGDGYFIADDPADIQRSIKRYNSRIHKQIAAKKGLEKALEEMKRDV